MIDPHEGPSPDDEAVTMRNYNVQATVRYARYQSLFFTTYHKLVRENMDTGAKYRPEIVTVCFS